MLNILILSAYRQRRLLVEEKDFNDKYWFSNTKIITVVNPRSEDYVFQATSDVGVDTATGKMKTEARKYRVKAGEHERFPGPIANMYLDQMSKLIAQDEEKFQFMIDFSLKAQYYDDLIVGVEDLMNTYHENPAYLNNKAEEVDEETPEVAEEPFAAAKPERKPGRPPKTAAKA